MSISDNQNGERLQKIIAMAGITSRRDAEELIREGLVTVNGKVAKLGDKAVLGRDAIKVKGKLILSAKEKVYYLFYKPKNVIAMIAEDEEGRPTIKDFLSRIKERVFAIGRMDFTGEGAILLTNDGELAQKMQQTNDIIRRYQVKVDRHPSSEDLAKLARGGRIEGRSMQPYHVRLVENYQKNSLIEISFEGMGSIEIRQYFENKGFFPEKIARVGIGHLRADNLAPGQYKKLEASSVQALFTQPELAQKHIERLVEKSASKTKTIREGKESAPRTSRPAPKSIIGAPVENLERPRSRESRVISRDTRTSSRDTRVSSRDSRDTRLSASRASAEKKSFGSRTSEASRPARPARGSGKLSPRFPNARPSARTKRS